jgi:hypothetical protein
MKALPASAAVQAPACALVAACCVAAPELAGRATAAGAAEAATAAPKAHAGTSRVVCAAADALACLSAADPAGAARATTAGACELLSAAVLDAGTAQVAPIHSVGCDALAALARACPAANVRAGAPRGGVDAALSAMAAGPDVEPVQVAACGAIEAFAVLPANAARATEGGAVEAAIAAMRSQPAPAAQAAAGRALWRLCFETELVVPAWERATAAPKGLKMLWRAFKAQAAQTGTLRTAARHADGRMLKAAVDGTMQQFAAALLQHTNTALAGGSQALRMALNAAVVEDSPFEDSEHVPGAHSRRGVRHDDEY